MKKTLLATAIISGLVSATAGAATVYDNDGTTMKIGGRAEVRGVFGDGVDGTMEDKSRARINFDASTQISENLTGFGFMEYELTNTSSLEVEDGELEGKSALNTRYLYAGIGTQIGDFSYGKQNTAGVQISDFTDIASNHSGEQQIIDAASDKQNNTFAYSGTFADGLTVQASYIAEKDEDDDSFGISAAYEFDFGLNIGAAYASADDDSNQATFGAGYTLNDLYVAATYSMGDIDANDDFTGLEVAAQYKFTKEFRLIGIYANVEEDSETTVDYVALEAQYRFNSSIRTYASYQLDNMDGGEDELMVGLRYNF